MATVLHARLPADRFALAETFSAFPDSEFEVERIIEHDADHIMPLVWARSVDREALASALLSDPSVEDVAVLTDLGTENLCRMRWSERVQLTLGLLTRADGTITDAHGFDGRWHFHVVYPERDPLAAILEECNEHDLSVHVESVHELRGQSGRSALTDRQYETLVLAAREGYFGVPRGSTGRQLAEELGVSPQAVSQRLRRAQLALIEDALDLDVHSSQTA